MSRRTRVLAAAGVAVVLAELADGVPRRRSRVLPDVPVVVVVLGFPGSNRLFRAVQRWRVRMGAEAAERFGSPMVVLSGGVTRSATSEAEEMAVVARRAGVVEPRLVLESGSRSTWENVERSRALVPPGTQVVLVSDALHAHRARRYWLRQDPAADVVVDPRLRPFRAWWLKTPSIAGGAAKLLQESLRGR